MIKYLARRLLQSIPIFFGVTILSYLLISLAPGGPVEILAFNNRLKPREREVLKYILGANDPLPVQYLRWLLGDDWMRWDSDGDGLADSAVFFIDLYAPQLNDNGKPLLDEETGDALLRLLPPGNRRGIIRGDFGKSVYYKRAALDVLVERLPATLELGATSLLVGLILGVAIGVMAAVNRGGWFDQSSRVGAVIVNSVPNFGLGLLLLLFFGVTLGIVPLAGRCKTTIDDSCPPLPQRLEYLILPTIVLSAGGVAVYSRFMRASMLDVVSQDYIRTALAKGLTERIVWLRHGMRNALIPIAVFLGPSITLLLSGAVVTESVFSWPGVGRLLIQAPQRRDYTVVMIAVVYGAIANIIGYLLSDIFCALIDPRIRFD